MIVKKGQKLSIRHDRKGKFEAVALKDFDTEKDEFYPVATLKYVAGMNRGWVAGDEIPCRKGLCKITLVL